MPQPNQTGNEYELQRKFYDKIGVNPDLSHNTDGIFGGSLFENKLVISDLNKVLSQAIKYASRIRIRGEKLPANIILNDLLAEKAYIFKSVDFLSEIEKVYFGAASKNNDGFTTTISPLIIDYSDSYGLNELLQCVNQREFTRYHVDKTNIIGLSQQYYKIVPDKDKFIKKDELSEIRNPTILSDRIYPYLKSDNLEFEDIMDCLNPTILQREQGAYYTPEPYVAKMHEMLYQAIKEIPKGMDYIIIDRCAGTGNLEEGLSDEILSHCILSTIEPNEYAILNYKYGDKCLVVIPNIDALAYDIIPAEVNIMGGVENDFIREKIQDENTVIILIENPPYSESGSGGTQNSGKKDNLWKQSYVMKQMKKDSSISGSVYNDICNLFIWSGFKYYLRSPFDNYILFSPTKPWRNQNLINKKFFDGFLCDRRKFHTGQKIALFCVWWKNIDDYTTSAINLIPYDIVGNSAIPLDVNMKIQKAKHNLSEAYDNRTFDTDEYNGVLCEANGTEFEYDSRRVRTKPIYNENIIAYLKADSFAIDRKHLNLTRTGYFKGDGFFVRKDNFLEKLPLFVASVFPYDQFWYTGDIYSKSYDGQGSYLSDKDFLKQCLIYTALSPKNKCRSFLGSDGRFYRNELCFHFKDTIAYNSLQKLINEGCSLTDVENNLLLNWDIIVEQAKNSEEYSILMHNPKIRLGFWQIKEEINIKIETGNVDKHGKPILRYKYPILNSHIKTLDLALKEYYQNQIYPKLFEYQLIK